MLKILILGLLLFVGALVLGYWNYRQVCHSANKLLREIRDKN